VWTNACTLHGFFDDEGGQIVGANVLELAAVAAHRGAGSRDDDRVVQLVHHAGEPLPPPWKRGCSFSRNAATPSWNATRRIRTPWRWNSNSIDSSRVAFIA